MRNGWKYFDATCGTSKYYVVKVKGGGWDCTNAMSFSCEPGFMGILRGG